MGMAYRIMLCAADENLKAGRSVIVTATFSRKIYQQMVNDLLAKHTDAQLRAIWCLPKNDSDEEIERRLSRGFGDGGYVGGVNSLARYNQTKDRYEAIELFPALQLDTSPPNTAESCAEQALGHILS